MWSSTGRVSVATPPVSVVMVIVVQYWSSWHAGGSGEESYFICRKGIRRERFGNNARCCGTNLSSNDETYRGWSGIYDIILKELEKTKRIYQPIFVILSKKKWGKFSILVKKQFLINYRHFIWHNWFKKTFICLGKTYPTNSQVADSACSATAYLCGVKGNLGTIGVDVNVNREDCSAMNNPEFQTPSIAKWFQDAGRSSGIVTTMRVTHASPAGAYAHIADRSWEDDHYVADDGWSTEECDDIAEQLILGDPGKDFKVIMGGGRRGLFPNTDYDVEADHHGYRHDGKNLINSWLEDKTSRGASAAYVWNREDLLTTNMNDTDYLMGLFAHSHMDYLVERDSTMDPSLPEMTRAAIQVLRKDDNGYFLFVEGNFVDDYFSKNHSIKLRAKSLRKKKSLDIMQSEIREDTLILVTADHAHSMTVNGYPARHTDILGYGDTSNEDDLPYTTLLYGNGPGYIEKRYDISNDDFHDVDYRQNSAVPYSTSAHAGDDIGLWAVGPHAHLFTGVYEQNYIPHALAYASCVGDGLTFCNNK
ncbi:unnamed protein product, partial [Meganyctiphanes norvegica]